MHERYSKSRPDDLLQFANSKYADSGRSVTASPAPRPIEAVRSMREFQVREVMAQVPAALSRLLI